MGAGDEGEEYGFDRGSMRSYELEVGDALGTLRSVFVQQVRLRSPALRIPPRPPPLPLLLSEAELLSWRTDVPQRQASITQVQVLTTRCGAP